MKRCLFAIIILSFGFCLAGADELLFTPSGSQDEALALPADKELACELLWDVWKSHSPSTRGKTGLVLSGGGARGFAHLGVLRHLEEIGFPIEGIAGTSMGGVIGGLYAAGVGIDRIEVMANDKILRDFWDVSTVRFLGVVFRDGMASSEGFERWLTKALGNKTFEDLPIPLVVTATDLATGDLVLLREGPMVPALRASATVPGFFAPAALRNYFLVDGGLILNVPTEAADLIGLENVLVVDTSLHKRGEVLTRAPSALKALYLSLEIQGDYLQSKKEKTGDFILRAYHPDIVIFEFNRWKEAWEVGLREARNNSYALRLAFITKTMTKMGAKFFELEEYAKR